MKRIRFVQHAAAALACVGMLFPAGTFAAPVEVANPALDIALQEGGLLVGQVVDAQGAPLTKADVSIRQGGVEVVSVKTNEEGVYAAKGLRGGLVEVVAGEGRVAYRLWEPQTAPPAANKSALMVTGADVVNGQFGFGGGGAMDFMRQHPMLVAAGIATAIAVPLALADDDDSAS
ncbi:hypothetical protein Mal64_31070 [Pseudobythopirellula maris]|uniref:Nickel uptake substrate-specific transmembrane region n=1 Tax=Pseudobythopirellula maris TaxID=2527991 RepID=A0A5C5ZKA7_9BACT|nr:carboxypeptidase-like regulatory domain-containing protein [Pseudobythopirellula maris]TWT87565.1 hypothetical protein Mal64_31070 [Pseudobythopirellula maris]